jgi:nitrite reductase/ring-hydroxylating ferredoxin subunit
VIEMQGHASPDEIGGFLPVADLDAIEDGEIEPFTLEGRAIVVARDGGALYGFDESCTHKRCSLLDGEIEDGVVSCPCHGAEFDLVTGDVLVGPATIPLPIHQIRVEDGRILVRLSSVPALEDLF